MMGGIADCRVPCFSPDGMCWQFFFFKSQIKLMQAFLIIDSHSVSRKGIQHVVTSEVDGAVCWQASSIQEALSVLAARRVDCIITELMLPDDQFPGMLKKLISAAPLSRVIVYSMLPGRIYAPRLLPLGVRFFINKEDDLSLLINALHAVRDEEPGPVAAYKNRAALPKVSNPIKKLSDTESNVMELLLRGFGVNQIALEINIKSKTVVSIKKRIFKKCDVSNVLELSTLRQISG